jgi:hypothetical protein
MITGTVIYGREGRRRYACRAIDERALFQLGADPDRLLPLVLCAEDPAAIAPDDLPHLPLIDYELILAHLCTASFGAIVGQNVDCRDCGKKFAVEVSLPDWVAEVRRGIDAPAFDGAPFALPTRALVATVGRDARALAQRLRQGDALLAESAAAFEAAVAAACPLLADEIVAPCPRCGAEARHRFVLRQHLAGRLRGRLQALLGDIHVLASTYHWRPAQILDLPRQTRTALIDTIRQSLARRRALGA